MNSFFAQPDGMTVREIVTLTGAKPRDGAQLDGIIAGVASIDRARPTDITFIEAARYAGRLATTRAGVCLATERFAEQAPPALTILVSAEPFRDFVTVARHLYPQSLSPGSNFGQAGVAERAVVHPTAEIEDDVSIDPGAVIGPHAAIGSGTLIGANAVIGPHVTIGRNCSIGSNSTIVHSMIGDRVVIFVGCAIGQDGFRYHMTARGHIKVPQLGRVIIQDDVEIGANCTIDRGGIGDTTIGEGTKIDNAVHIAHNVILGRHCAIAGQCGIAGSTVLGDHVVLGGQVGIADHLTIGDGTIIGAKSGVVSNIPAGERWLGFPAMPGREFLRVTAALRKRSEATMDEVTRDVVAIIGKKIPGNTRELQLSDRLDELGLDSFAAVEMIFDLEEKFDIQIPYNSNDARADFETVGDVVDAIKRRIGQG